MRIAVVAPASRLSPEVPALVQALAARLYPDRTPSLFFHPQCFLSSGHFAGDDAARAAALVEVANSEAHDAIWFARGGYGSGRLIERVLPQLGPDAQAKTWLGYSDAGALLAAFQSQGFRRLAHGPIPQDILREGGEVAVTRALAWLVDRDPAALEPSLAADPRPAAAFNLTILCSMLGTPWQPDLAEFGIIRISDGGVPEEELLLTAGDCAAGTGGSRVDGADRWGNECGTLN